MMGELDDLVDLQGEFLADVRSRIDHIEDNFHVEYPDPDTPAGGAQRVRIEVPSPATVMTIGAQGNSTAEGVPLGPGGFGLRTVEHFGAQIGGRTCLNSVGLTIVHSADPMRLLTQADLGIASVQAIRIGTDQQNVEITAGHVPAIDPAFTVAPAMPVPDAPNVDTAGPRAAIESWKTAASAGWDALELATSVRTLWGFRSSWSLTSGVASGTLLARVAGIVNIARSGASAGQVLYGAVLAAAAALDLFGIDNNSSSAPKVNIHGAGGVNISSPEAVSAFAPKISLTGRDTASLKATTKVSVKSLGYTGIYGAATATVSSEGPAILKSTHNAASVSGKYAEVLAKETTAVRSEKTMMLSAKREMSLESPKIGLAGGVEIALSSDTIVEAEAPIVSTKARRQNIVWSDQTIDVKAGRRITMGRSAGSTGEITTGIEIVDGRITLDAGDQRGFFRIERGRAQLARTRFSESEVSIHGLVIRR